MDFMISSIKKVKNAIKQKENTCYGSEDLLVPPPVTTKDFRNSSIPSIPSRVGNEMEACRRILGGSRTVALISSITASRPISDTAEHSQYPIAPIRWASSAPLMQF